MFSTFCFIIIGLVAGFISGILGVGGGLIIIPSLVVLLGYSQHMAQGTSLAALLLPIGLFATYEYYKHGNVHIYAAIIIIIAFLIASYFGAFYAHSISDASLKKVFAIYLFIMSMIYFYIS